MSSASLLEAGSSGSSCLLRAKSQRRVCQHLPAGQRTGKFLHDGPTGFISYENRLLQSRTIQRTGFLGVKLNFVMAIHLICLPRTSNVCQDCQPDPARLAKPGRTLLIPNATSLQDRTGLLGITFADKGVRPNLQQRSKVKRSEP